MKRELIQERTKVLKEWVRLDRLNLVHRSAGMYWVVGPAEYETNRLPMEAGEWIAFYWHPDNLEVCERNLGRCATALRLVSARYGRSDEPSLGRQKALDQVLRAHAGCLDPLAKGMLQQHVGLELDQ